MANIEIFKGSNKIILKDNEFLTSGGEGSIYIKKPEVYKIYLDTMDLNYVKKLEYLAILDKNNILAPREILYNNKKYPIGFTMKFVDNTEALAKLFTNSFRNRNGIDNKKTIKLIEEMIETIDFIHNKDITIVDGNELNYLVDKSNFELPYFIDVDSYQTRDFPAKVIMPSIRDYSSKKFDSLTDWYSFAIIAFQLFIGIHPFKGKHPNYSQNDLEKRMRENISVFNKNVSMPKAIRDIDEIPIELRNWFFDLFEKGERKPPPSILGNVVLKPKEIVVLGNNKIDISLDKEYDENILYIEDNIVYTKNYCYINGVKRNNKGPVFEYKGNFYSICIKDQKIILYNVIGNIEIHIHNLLADKAIVINNKPYIFYNEKFMELMPTELNNKLYLTIKNSWDILKQSTKVYKNILISNVLGKAYFYIPNSFGCYILPVKELHDIKVLDAEFENDIATIIGYRKGKYIRLLFKFNENKYTVDEFSDISPTETNFVVLPNGVIVTLTTDNEIYINAKTKSESKIFTDVPIDAGSRLFNSGMTVKFFINNKIYIMRIK